MVKRQLSSQESHEGQPVLRRRGLQSLVRGVSPPPKQSLHKQANVHLKTRDINVRSQVHAQKCNAAAIEAGEQIVADHVAFYSAHLLSRIRPAYETVPRTEHAEWLRLYLRNAENLDGCHFVIHQHDHPIAGTHYDLRLQCNPTSSISFAIMYGLPGDPNSRRLNRNATETRVHCLWNHLIETASHSTGSMLIWDTGEFEVMPYGAKDSSGTTTEEDTDCEGVELRKPVLGVTEQDKLRQAFRGRKVRLRLHGTRLPKGYTLSLRLTKSNDRYEQPKKPSRQRRRVVRTTSGMRLPPSDSSTDRSDDEALVSKKMLPEVSDIETATAIASDAEDETIRNNNAYTGATNDVGSIHQRRWFLSIDRKACGFEKLTSKSDLGVAVTNWIRKQTNPSTKDLDNSSISGFERFVVGGRDTERSIVTGRLASEILVDEGVFGFVPRGLWGPITV